jgi:chromosomal replication initiation ATPase DnaA
VTVEQTGTDNSGRKQAVRVLESMVALAFGVAPEDLQESTRGRAQVAFARQVAIYLAHTRLGLSYRDAGECFDRDRTTAAHACRTVEERRDDHSLDTLLDCLERSIDVVPQDQEKAMRPV